MSKLVCRLAGAVFFTRLIGTPLLVLLILVAGIFFLRDAAVLVGEPLAETGKNFKEIGGGLANLQTGMEAASETVKKLQRVKAPRLPPIEVMPDVTVSMDPITNGLNSSFSIFRDLGNLLGRLLGGLPILLSLQEVATGLSAFASKWSWPVIAILVLAFVVWLLGYVDFATQALPKIPENWGMLKHGTVDGRPSMEPGKSTTQA